MANWFTMVLSLEGVAVVFALAYLLLAARESLWCWWCALLSSLLYVWVMWQSRLYMETALNVFYAVMAVIGWLQWRSGAAGSGTGDKMAGELAEKTADHSLEKPAANTTSAHRPIITLHWSQHALCWLLIVGLALVNGWLMQRFTQAAWPFVDSFITWGCVVTTFLVVWKVLENWLYWLVLDGVAIVVYLERGLTLTALLFAAYVVIVLFGYRQWRRQYRAGLQVNRSGH
jgi:nicotinamide mononucleotide transporter